MSPFALNLLNEIMRPQWGMSVNMIGGGSIATDEGRTDSFYSDAERAGMTLVDKDTIGPEMPFNCKRI